MILSLSAIVSFTFLSATTVTGENSFTDRCQAAGVIKCMGFDSDSEVLNGNEYTSSNFATKLTTAWDGVEGFDPDETQSPLTGYPDSRVTIDTAIKSDGAGALRFSIPSLSASNSTGQFLVWFCDNQVAGYAGECEFEEHSTFYIQYRQRFGPNYLSFYPDAGGSTGVSWSSSHPTLRNPGFHSCALNIKQYYYNGIPIITSSCPIPDFRLYHMPYGNTTYWFQWAPPYEIGDPTHNVDAGNSLFPSPSGVNEPSGTIHCYSGSSAEPACLRFVENEWMTFYWVIKQGTWGGKDSHVELWASRRPGEPLEQIIDGRNRILAPKNTGAVWDMLQLGTSMHAKDATIDHTPVQTWYDELIISSQPIGDPDGPAGASVHMLTVSTAGSGTGTITSSPPGITCGTGGTDCSEAYNTNSYVVLTATADSGSLVGSWGGACSGTDPDSTCTLTITEALAVSATFTAAGAFPNITSFIPQQGPFGTEVLITGENFDSVAANNQVQFNGMAATVTAATTTNLTAVVPTGATTGPITITTVAGTATSATDFTVESDPPGGPGENSFTERCQAAGVIKCMGFDDDSEVLNTHEYTSSNYATKLTTAWDGVEGFDPDETHSPLTGYRDSRVTIDTAIKSDGAGALRFSIPPLSASNSTGQFLVWFCDDQEASYTGECEFEEHSAFYIQYRQRFGPDYLSFYPNAGGSTGVSWSSSDPILRKPNISSCGLNIKQYYYNGVPIITSSCPIPLFRQYHTPYGGANYWFQWAPPYETGSATHNVDAGNWQFPYPSGVNEPSGTIQCHYGNYNEPACLRYVEEEWMTFYWVIKQGTWGGRNSHVELWASRRPGEPLEQIIDGRNRILTPKNDGSVWDMLKLGTSMYAKSASIDHTPVQTWYDELIISSQPIADPAGPAVHTLTVTSEGSGAGTITSASPAISCGTAGSAETDCLEAYNTNSYVILTATAESGSLVGSWGGACSGTDPASTCTLTITEALTVTATFISENAPSITSFTPQEGPVDTEVLITGENFDPILENNEVQFNGVTATVTAATTTNLTAVVPAGATTGPISVTTAAGTATSATDFTVITGPTITNFTPTSVSVGDQVTITGQGFTSPSGGAPQVSLAQQGGGTIGATITGSTDTTIAFTVPTGVDTGAVTVTVDGQSATSTDTLTIVASQTYSLTVEPSTADVIQGQSVSYAVNLDSTNGFTQLAPLAVSGLPPGVTAEFNPPQITAGQTVVLTVTAPSGQTPETASLTVSVSATVEGIDLTETANVSLTVQPVTTSFLGRTVVADTLQIPLAGVTVTMLGVDGSGNATGCTGQTVSDAAGNFALTNLASNCSGGQLIRYDGSTAISPTGTYAGVDLFYSLVTDQVTVSPVLVHLPRIDNAETVMVQQNHSVDQTFTFQTIPNLTATVYAGTTFTLLDGTQPNPFPLVAIRVPVDRLPEEMAPSNTVEPFIVAFQPANATASQPVAVSFPNLLNTAPGTTSIPLSTLDPTLGVMVDYGTGTVSDDGLQVIPDLDPANPGKRFGLVHFDWHGARQTPSPTNPSPDDDPTECGDPIDLASCIQVVRETDIEINGSRGRIAIDRNYRSLSTNQGPFGIGTNHNYGHRLDTIFTQTSTVIRLVMPNGSRFPFVKQADGTLVNETVPTVRGAVMSVLADGDVDLRWKDGTVFHFHRVNFTLGSVLETIKDRNGNQITLTRNASRPAQILEVTDPVGRKLTLNYDGADRITSIIDPIGRAVQYTYNTQGTLETVIDPEDGVTRYDYDTENRLIRITDARGIVVAQNTYDANGRVIQQIQADGGVWTFDFELFNPLVPLSPLMKTTVTDPKGNVFSHRFNPEGFVISSTDALGQTTDFEIENGTNLLLSTTDPLGHTTHFTYDERGNRTSITDPDGKITSFEYHPSFNLITKVTDALGNRTILEYDTQGNLMTLTDPLDQISTLTHNQFGQLISRTDPLGVTDPLGSHTTTLAYHSQGDVESITDPQGNVTQRNYDAISRLIELRDPLGFTTTFEYNNLDRIVSFTDARTGTTQFSYDPNANLIRLIDAEGHETTFDYDPMDRLSIRKDALGRQEISDYDFNGNLIQFTDRKNQVATFEYDTLDRQSSATYADGSSTTFTHDTVSRLAQITDSQSGTIVRAYDNLDRLIQETTSQGIITYTYDDVGLRETMSINGQEVVEYEFDDAYQLIQVAQGTNIVGIGYDVAGRRESLTYPNGTSTTYIFNDASRLESLVHQGPAGLIESLTYTYDAAGNRKTLTRTNGIASNLPDSVQAAYDAANKQIEFNSATPNLTYDLNGNLETQTDVSGTTTYVWDARNRLIAMNGPGITASFAYDAENRRISKTINGVTTDYQYDGPDIIAEITGGIVGATYLRGLRLDEPFIRRGTTNEYYHSDALGSTLALSDNSGNVQASYSYDPFGNTIISGTTTNPFQYAGREQDGNGLYYYRARYYSPELHRFINEDPIGLAGGGVNLYSYVRNSPLNFIDSEGEAIVAVYPIVIGIGEFFSGAGGAAALLAILSTAGDSQADSARIPNTQDPEGALESLEKAQQKHNKAKDKSSIKDPTSDWEGAKKRPKQSQKESTKRSQQRAKNNRKNKPQCDE